MRHEIQSKKPMLHIVNKASASSVAYKKQNKLTKSQLKLNFRYISLGDLDQEL